jgi:hypothetical protein
VTRVGSMRKILSLIAALALTGACARIEVVKATSENASLHGIRYYRPDLYVLVTARVDKDGKPTGLSDFEIVPLPNTKEEYIIHPVSGLGSSEMQPTLKDGWNLTALNAKQDSKVPEVLGSIASLATAAKGFAAAEKSPLASGLYRIKYDSDGHVAELVPVHIQ